MLVALAHERRELVAERRGRDLARRGRSLRLLVGRLLAARDQERQKESAYAASAEVGHSDALAASMPGDFGANSASVGLSPRHTGETRDVRLGAPLGDTERSTRGTQLAEATDRVNRIARCNYASRLSVGFARHAFVVANKDCIFLREAAASPLLCAWRPLTRF